MNKSPLSNQVIEGMNKHMDCFAKYPLKYRYSTYEQYSRSLSNLVQWRQTASFQPCLKAEQREHLTNQKQQGTQA